MSFENPQPEENKIEFNRTPLELKMEIQRSFLGHRYTPGKDDPAIMKWIMEGGADKFDIAYNAYLQENENAEFIWNHAPESVLEWISSRMEEFKDGMEDHRHAA